jgi:hypothetical protein
MRLQSGQIFARLVQHLFAQLRTDRIGEGGRLVHRSALRQRVRRNEREMLADPGGPGAIGFERDGIDGALRRRHKSRNRQAGTVQNHGSERLDRHGRWIVTQQFERQFNVIDEPRIALDKADQAGPV